MERTGIVQLVRDHERPYYVKPGRPLYTEAFRRMVADSKLNTYMSMLSAKWLCNQYTQKILNLETELNSLNDDSWWFWSNGTNARKRWIRRTIGVYHEKAKTYFDLENQLKSKIKLAE
jgi:hypothetical protein